jgi:hypothetical protein
MSRPDAMPANHSGPATDAPFSAARNTKNLPDTETDCKQPVWKAYEKWKESRGGDLSGYEKESPRGAKGSLPASEKGHPETTRSLELTPDTYPGSDTNVSAGPDGPARDRGWGTRKIQPTVRGDNRGAPIAVFGATPVNVPPARFFPAPPSPPTRARFP